MHRFFDAPGLSRGKPFNDPRIAMILWNSDDDVSETLPPGYMVATSPREPLSNLEIEKKMLTGKADVIRIVVGELEYPFRCVESSGRLWQFDLWENESGESLNLRGIYFTITARVESSDSTGWIADVVVDGQQGEGQVLHTKSRLLKGGSVVAMGQRQYSDFVDAAVAAIQALEAEAKRLWLYALWARVTHR